jgi:hypothetical protein
MNELSAGICNVPVSSKLIFTCGNFSGVTVKKISNCQKKNGNLHK